MDLRRSTHAPPALALPLPHLDQSAAVALPTVALLGGHKRHLCMGRPPGTPLIAGAVQSAGATTAAAVAASPHAAQLATPACKFWLSSREPALPAHLSTPPANLVPKVRMAAALTTLPRLRSSSTRKVPGQGKEKGAITVRGAVQQAAGLADPAWQVLRHASTEEAATRPWTKEPSSAPRVQSPHPALHRGTTPLTGSSAGT